MSLLIVLTYNYYLQLSPWMEASINDWLTSYLKSKSKVDAVEGQDMMIATSVWRSMKKWEVMMIVIVEKEWKGRRRDKDRIVEELGKERNKQYD